MPYILTKFHYDSYDFLINAFLGAPNEKVGV